jgi:antitoxin component HigA of HigAB toxin-antitoxin module
MTGKDSTGKPVSATLNRKSHGSLLKEDEPKVIIYDEEYNLAIESIDKLMESGEEVSSAETSLLELLSILVEMYEDSQFSLESASPQ